MNRRSFFTKLAVAAAGFAILPPATTYDRIWKPAPRSWIINPEWEKAPYALSFVAHTPYHSIILDEMPRFQREEGNIILVPKYLSQ